MLPSDKVAVQRDRDEPASAEIIFAAEGEPVELRSEAALGVVLANTRSIQMGTGIPSHPQRMGRIILQKITVWKMHAGGLLLSKT